MELKKIFRIMVIIGIIVIIIDQMSKILISNLVEEKIEIIPNVFAITKVENEGIAFGLNQQNLGNIGLSILILVIVFNYVVAQKERLTKLVTIYLSLIMAGGISNLIDRIFKGAVFDFIKIGSFPVFNIADMCIVIGWLLFAINFIKYTAIDIKAEIPVKKK
ncbi:MAG: signal peptidase II [Clostridia bacterium]|nr:signal peptidase II [Clostridia bacterium]